MEVTNNTVRGVIYALLAALCWGFLAIFLKIAVGKVPPETIVWIRFIVAFSLLALFSLFKHSNDFQLLLKPPKYALLAGIFLGMNYLGFMIGVKHTTPNNSQIFIQIGPILLAIVGFLYYKEKINIKQTIGFIMALAGLTLFYSQQLQAFTEQENIYNKGVLWIIFGAVSWTAYALTQKNLVKQYTVNQLNLIIFGLPAIGFAFFADFSVLLDLSIKYKILLFLLGVNTLIAYTSIALALKYLEANKVSIIITNNPIITFITMAVLGYLEVSWIEPERMNILSIFGAILVISGSVTVILFRNKYQKTQTK